MATDVGGDAEDVRGEVDRLEALPISDFPLYMSSVPASAGDNVPLAALQALLFEGTPEEQARNFKTQGNECYGLGPAAFKDALKFYTRGIAVRCGDSGLNATLHLNRAAVNLALQNWGDALADAQTALALDPRTCGAKANARIAKAALQLWRVAEAEGAIAALCALAEPASAATEELQRELHALKAQIAREERVRAEAAAERERIAQVVRGCAVAVVPGAEDGLVSYFGPGFDPRALPAVHRDAASGERRWPVMLLYPADAQSDLLEAVDEASRFVDLLSTVFARAPEWEQPHRRYGQVARLRVFWHALGAQSALVEIRSSRTVGDVLGPVVQSIERGVLYFFVVPDGPDAQRLTSRFPALEVF